MRGLMEAIWANRGLDGPEKLVLLYLAWRANREGVCWPSTQTIAADTGLSRVGVARILGRLRDKGYISWERGERSNIYRLALDRICQAEGGVTESGTPEHATRLYRGSSGVLPADTEGVTESGTPGHAAPSVLPRVTAGVTESYTDGSLPPSVLPADTGLLPRVTPPVTESNRGCNRELHEPKKEPKREPKNKKSSPPPTPPHDDPGGEPEEGEEVKEEVKEEMVEMQEMAVPVKTQRTGTPGRDAGRGASPSPSERGSGDFKDFLAAALGTIPRTAMAQVPEVPAEMVRALRVAGVWDRLAPLRRYARDQRAWFSWLAGPLAALWRGNPEAFPAAIGEALDAVVAKPEVRDPLSYLLAVARKKLAADGGGARSGEDPAARAIRLLRGGQEPSDEDLAELFRQRGVPTKAGLGRYNGMSADGEWVYARLGGDIIAVPRREAVRWLVETHGEVANG